MSETLQHTNRFNSYTPKPDNIKAVKLTKHNLSDVAAYILKEVGGAVTFDEAGVAIGELIHSPVDGTVVGATRGMFEIGDWISEEYDYVANVVRFRKLGITDRQKYDLR